MNSPTFLRNVIAIGLPLAVIGTIILAVSYVNDQQILRGMANEPQEYVAGDAALRVTAAGALPTGGFASAVPIEADPAAYIIFYSATGTPVAGTGVLNGQPPMLPPGALETAKKNGVNRITWEPQPGVRQAIVIVPAGDGFVMSGRSLKYIEQQEAELGKRALLGWAVTMVAVLLVSTLVAWIVRKREEI